MFPNVINYIIAEYSAEYVLLDWIPENKIDWDWLSVNSAAIHLLEKHKDKIDWISLSQNPAIFKLQVNYKLVNTLSF